MRNFKCEEAYSDANLEAAPRVVGEFWMERVIVWPSSGIWIGFGLWMQSLDQVCCGMSPKEGSGRLKVPWARMDREDVEGIR